MHPHQQMNQMHHRSFGPMPHQGPPQMQHRGYAPMSHQGPPQIHHRPVMHQGKLVVYSQCATKMSTKILTKIFDFHGIESNLVATAFQGVASKIGTGIIEDPLAAFEQIMKEKERRKRERRIDSPPRRRSRSGERRRSPMDRRSPRHNSSDSRDCGRSTGTN